MPTRRLFVAVDLAPGARAEVARAVEHVRPLAPRARWVAPEKLHLTLQFLGAVEEDRASAVQGALDEVAALGAACPLHLAGAGAFGRPAAPSVLWLGVSEGQRELGWLAHWLGERLRPLGFLPDERAYVPHLTLARAGGRAGEPGFPGCVDALAHARFDGFRVDRLKLMETLPDGRYAVVHAAPLPAWRFSAHTSEVQLELEAGSLAGLLAAAARGFGELMLGDAPPWDAGGEVRALELQAADEVALLVGFLDELVFLADTVPGVPVRAQVVEAGAGRARAEVTVLSATSFKTAIKAATLHGARCERRDGAWQGRVVLDV